MRLFVIEEGSSLIFRSGKRKVTLDAKEISHYYGERGRRGASLPRGVQHSAEIEIIPPEKPEEFVLTN